MVTGIKLLSQQQVINNCSTMGLNGLTAAQLSNHHEAPVKRSSSDARRSNKPIMEKRRRARINNCLNELKTLILDAMKKDPARHSKLEKADILEMTVKYLQNHQINLQRQQAALSQAADATMATKFKSGFAECTNEVSRFPGLETQVKRRLLQHLHSCIAGNERHETHHHLHHQQQQQHHSFLPSPPSSPEQDSLSHLTSSQHGYYGNNSNAANAGLQLIPTKLPNGNIAFVVPQSPAAAQLPLLVPIPSRTASTGSANSSGYEHSTSPFNQPPSPANSSSYESTEHFFHHHHQQQRSLSPSSAPLSLVMRKDNFDHQMQDDEMWRPW